MYAIRNLNTGDWFHTRNGKFVWEKSNHAKNAWVNYRGTYSLKQEYPKGSLFDQAAKDEGFEVVRIEFIAVDDKENILKENEELKEYIKKMSLEMVS